MGTGGTIPVSSILTARESSTATPMAWPVYPFVLATTMESMSGPNTLRSACTSALALPPRAGVYVSWETNTASLASSRRLIPQRASNSLTSFSMLPTM